VKAIQEEIQKEQKYTERQSSLPLPEDNIKRKMERRSLSDNGYESSAQNIRVPKELATCSKGGGGSEEHSTPFYEFLFDHNGMETQRNQRGEVVRTQTDMNSGAIYVERDGDLSYVQSGSQYNNFL